MTRSTTLRRTWPHKLALLAAVIVLAGCENNEARKLLGLEKTTPDEFKIVSRAPLSLPPDYSLRPPAPGAQRPQELAIPQRALAAVTGNPGAGAARGAAPAANSAGESALLAKVGADRANPDIRTVLDREFSSLAEADTTLLDRLVFW